MKKVSVIIPTYKRSTNLVKAINSVLNQTYENIEIIVVDDNDSNSLYREENKRMLKEFVDNNKIIYLQHDINKNGAAARNTGLSSCTGDYITFLDDDDYYIKDRIEKMVNTMENNSEYDCAYSAVAYSINNKIVSVFSAYKQGNLKLDLLCQKSFFKTGSNLFFRRSVIEKIGLFDEGFVRHQDMEYMVRFFNYGKVIPINELLVVKCIDDSSNVPNYSSMLLTKEMYLNKFLNDINEYSENEKKNIYYLNYYEMLRLYPNRYKELKQIIEKYKKLTLLDKVKYILRRIKKNFSCINKVLIGIKKIKYKKYNYLIIK